MSVNDFFPGSSKEEKHKNENTLNLQKLTKPQLLELLDRQLKLISSPALKNLKDKGEKVKILKQQIENELAERDKPKDLIEELAGLSINGHNIQEIEWINKRGELLTKSNKANGESNTVVVDEKDPIAILATHSGTTQNQRIIREEAAADEEHVTLADIEEAYAIGLCSKIDKTVSSERFMPHRTLNKTLPSTKSRDLSAATPPVPVFGNVKPITLEESLLLQYEHTKHLRLTQLKHATDRLKEMYKLKMGDHLPSEDSIKTYRPPEAAYNEDESDDEKKDEEE